MPAARPIAWLLCLLAMFTCGCGSTQPRTGQAGSTWIYGPQAIRVHPLSRVKFDPETGEPHVEARIEMIDRDGFSTRGSGQLVLMLSGSPSSGAHSEVRWECDLSDPKSNGTHFDCVTRTYQARLELEQASDVPLEPHLRAVLTLPDGRALSDTEAIRIKSDAADSEDLDD